MKSFIKRKGYFWIFLFLVGLSILSSALLAQQSDLLLEANFNENSPDATSPKGKVKDALAEKGNFVFQEGIFSNAILLSGNSLSFPAKGNINPNNGSVSFWIKPLDWGNQAESFIPIWTIDKEKGKSWTLLLYYAKNKGSRYGFLSFRSMFQGKRLIIMEERSLRQGKLQKNQWTHIVLTWNTMELKLYLDDE